MKKIILVFGLLSSTVFATVQPSRTCVDLTGHFIVPLQPRQSSKDPRWVMEIDQDQCRLLGILVNEGGIIPIQLPFKLDGSEGWHIVKDTIVRKGSNVNFITGHGNCETKLVILSLDENKDLVLSSPKITNCEDKYRGAYRETFPRVHH
jgi:hypothetical protein